MRLNVAKTTSDNRLIRFRRCLHVSSDGFDHPPATSERRSGYPLSDPPNLRGMEPRGSRTSERWNTEPTKLGTTDSHRDGKTRHTCTLCEEVRIGVPEDRTERTVGRFETY